jgi:prepilin-type N-terminal cleavage/methylation domain-containing protein
MKTSVNRFKAGEKGFTLVELLVAIAILGILAAIAIPQVSKFLNSASIKAATTELSMVHAGAVPTTDNLVADIAPYITSPLRGTYSIDAVGMVTQLSYPGVDSPPSTISI